MSHKSPSLVALAYPGCTLLDLIGPHSILTQVPSLQAGIYWKERGPIPTDSGATILADHTFEEVPQNPTILLVPGGGAGTIALLNDPVVIDWLKSVGDSAEWVTSVCSGALLLGAAGLLQGYRATSHWSVKDELSLFGAQPTPGRVVTDRNRMTGGGVTAGIDFGLTLASKLAGEPVARAISLAFEYAPEPPFASGTPELAGPELTKTVVSSLELGEARSHLERASQKLRQATIS